MLAGCLAVQGKIVTIQMYTQVVKMEQVASVSGGFR